MDKKLSKDVIPILIGAIALIISIKSCAISQRAISISTSEFQLSRSLVLTGTFSEDQNELKLKSLSEDMKVMTLTIYTPSKVSETEAVFTKGFVLERYPPLTLNKSDINDIRELIIKNHIEHDCNRLQNGILIFSRIPILIETSYLVKGDKVSDTSIYTMKYLFFQSGGEDNKIEVPVILANFEFYTHLDPEDWKNTLRKLRSGKPWIFRFDGKQTIFRFDEIPTFTKFDGLKVKSLGTKGDSNE